ncbi:MAG: hypothetical protein F7C33_03505 [Desulfurococcales archaeon]|nr:hypothetical protein [Desulfurococcales archaeon]
MPEEIRLVRSSVVLYGVIIWRLFVSAGYAVVVARRLSVDDFALLGLVIAFSMVFMWPIHTWLYWAQRAAARELASGEKRAGVTGLAVTVAYTLVIIPVYTAVAWAEARVLGYGLGGLLMGLAYIAIIPLNNYLSGIAGVVYPESIAAARLLADTTRLVLAILLVTLMGLGYEGAIVSLALSAIVAGGTLTLLLYKRGTLKGRVDWSLARAWLRAYYTPGLKALIGIVRFLTRPFISWTTGNPEAVAYLHAGLAGESPLVQASTYTAGPLYSRMLRNPKPEDVTTSLGLYLVFTGFLVTAFIGLSKPIATTYNPVYAPAWVSVSGVAIYAFLYGIANILSYALTALDESDRKAPPVGRGTLMARVLETSLLFLLLAYAISAPATYLLRRMPANAVIAFLGILAGASLAQVIVFSKWLHERLPFRAPTRELAGFLAGGLAAIAYYHLTGASDMIVYKFTRDVWPLLLHLAVSGVLFYAVMITVSPLARGLIRRLFRMITG